MLADEDAWVLPEAWRAGLHPRRGGAGVAAPEIPAEAVAMLCAIQEDARTVTSRQRIAERDVIFDPGLLSEGEQWLADPQVGGSARAAAVAALIGGRGEETAHFYARVWASAGVVFAAAVIGEMAVLIAGRSLWTVDPEAEKTYQRWWRGDDLTAFYAMARAVRPHLAAAADDAYEGAGRVLAGYRTSPIGRIVASYLMPTRADWVDADCAAAAGWRDDDGGGPDLEWGDHRRLCGILLLAASSTRHLDRLRDVASPALFSHPRLGEVATVLDGVGPAAVPMIFEPFYREALGLHDHGARHGLEGRIGPLALSVLPVIPTDDAMLVLCQGLITDERSRPGALFASKVLSRYPVRSLRVLAELAACGESDLWQDLLGGVLLGEPRLLPAVADRLPPAVRARCAEIVASGGAGIGRAWAAMLDAPAKRRIFDSAADERRAVAALAAIPTEEALGLLADRIDRRYVRPELLRAGKRDPALLLRVLLARAGDGETVDALLREHARAYPEVVFTLDPGTLGEAQRAALVVVRSRAGGRSVESGEGVTPPFLAGGQPRELPEWLVVPALPAIRLRDAASSDERLSDVAPGRERLSDAAVWRLCELLAASAIGEARAGIAEVREIAEEGAAARFAWAIFEQWKAAGYPARSSLGMVALALLGDDDVVGRLTALFPEWATSSMRVRTGMDVLAAIGTGGALASLERLSRTARTKGFRRLAAERLAGAAEARGLRPEQLADRLVPTLGLDEYGRLELGDGPHRYSVTVDDQLRPVITDAAGKRLSRLPGTASSRFAAFRKELKAVAAERIRALEEAMATGRRWPAEEFTPLLVRHPVTGSLTRRLLWVAFGEDGSSAVFRVARDGNLADRDGKEWRLDPAATVGVAHPWHFAADREAWAAVLAEHAVIQPFAQVGRELFTEGDPLPPAGAEVPGSRLFVLGARGWRVGAGHGELVRDWPGGRRVTIGFEPGYDWHDPDAPRRLGEVRIAPDGSLAALSPVGLSEVIRDVRFLAS
ncbi:DUF4132 domain-containing protein [Actinoplanes sp. NPDC023714]|uniref:DUF4132 domain-containing protein n=1 Tax=Actinoplanes sp. NPDC023714 TaxID=3154322 RepID=UPI00340E166C